MALHCQVPKFFDAILFWKILQILSYFYNVTHQLVSYFKTRPIALTKQTLILCAVIKMGGIAPPSLDAMQYYQQQFIKRQFQMMTRGQHAKMLQIYLRSTTGQQICTAGRSLYAQKYYSSSFLTLFQHLINVLREKIGQMSLNTNLNDFKDINDFAMAKCFQEPIALSKH